MQAAPQVTRIGRYEVLAQLGRGAMGVVYQARDPQIERLVAIKTILWMGDEAHDYRRRFMQEAKAAGRLSHPGIVQVFDVGQDPDSELPYIVMEYVAGQPLNKLLSALPGCKLPLPDALRLTEEIAEALAYAHSQGVVHRDIKPANILVSEEGHAKIADFGVAKLDLANLTLAGHAVGTPAYMAPEQLAGEAVDGRADLFSLGVILYSMIAGFRPFQGRGNSTIAHKVRHGEPLPVSTVDVNVPADLDELLARAMAKRPNERFQSGTEMVAAIRKLRGVEQPPSSSTNVRAVMQETGAHVACLAPEKRLKTPSPEPPHRTAEEPPQPVPARQVGQNHSRLSTRRVLATGLTAAMLAAGAVAWRLHASIHTPPQAQPVTWENSPPLGQYTPTMNAQEATVNTPAPVAQPIMESGKKGPTTQSLRKVASSVGLSGEHAASMIVTPPASDNASVQLALEHPFADAQLTLWVGDRQVLSESTHGEKKRVLMFQRTRGTFTETVSVPAGSHFMRLRIQSSRDHYDVSQGVSAEFAKSSQWVLRARCDKNAKEMKLSLAPATVTAAAK